MADNSQNDSREFDLIMRVTTVDQDLAVVLSPEAARKLSVAEGSVLTGTLGEGGLTLRNASPLVRQRVNLVDAIIKRRRAAILRAANQDGA